jgi:TP901 family phage tail tape measure protein
MSREIFKLHGVVEASGLQQVLTGLEAIDKQFAKADKALTKFARQMVSVGTTLSKNVTLPLTLLGGAAIKFGADFEKSMTTSVAIMGDISGEMREKLETAAREIAKTTTVSANAAAKAYYYLVSAGYSAADAVGALPKVVKFALAGQMQLEEATSLLADSQNALGLKVKDTAQNMENMARVSDVMSQANNLANGSVQDFALALTNKGAAALRMVNKEVEEGVAVLMAYASSGVKGEEAGEKLYIVLRDLQTAALKFPKAFSDAGISVFDASGKMRNMADIIADLEKRLGGMSDAQKRQQMMTLGFQDRSVAATIQLLGQSKAIQQYESDLKKAAGTTETVAQKQMQNFSDQLTILKNKLVVVGIELYQTLQPILMNKVVPALENATKKISDIVKWFTSLDSDIKKTIISILGLITITGPLILGLGKTILLIHNLSNAFSVATKAISGLTAAMLTNPFIAAAVGAGAFLAIIIGIKKAYDDNLDRAKKWETMTKADASIKSITEDFKTLKEELAKIAPAMKNQSDATPIFGERMKVLAQRASDLGYEIDTLNPSFEDLQRVVDVMNKSMIYSNGQFKKAITNAKEIKNATKKGSGGNYGEIAKEELEFRKEYEAKIIESNSRLIQNEKDKLDAQLSLLDIEKEKAILSAQQKNFSVKIIEEYYQNEKTNKIKEYDKNRMDIERQYRIETANQLNTIQANETEDINIKLKKELMILKRNYDEKIRLAKISGKDISDIEEQYENERGALIKNNAKAIKENNAGLLQRILDQNGENVKSLNMQRDNELRHAVVNSESIYLINKYYDDKIKESRLSTINSYLGTAQNIISQIANLYQMDANNRIQELENQQKAQEGIINKSIGSEEQKKIAIDKLHEDTAKKEGEIRRDVAKKQKAADFLSAITGTAVAVVGALGMKPWTPINFVLAGIVGTLGLMQAALIASQPIPLAEGALVKGGRGGTQAQIGEGRQDEIVMPLKTGIMALAEGLIARMNEFTGINPVMAFAGNRGVSETHWHIGVLVADDRGIKELERRQSQFRISESQRKGAD